MPAGALRRAAAVASTLTSIDWLRVRAQTDPPSAVEAIRPLFGKSSERLRLGRQGRGQQGFAAGAPIILAEASVGRIDWGGESQRGWLRLEIPGEGCRFASHWQSIERLKELPGAEIRRLDIALTTFRGEITHEQVVVAHGAGMFTTGGRPPSLRQITSSDPSASRTCYVGSRTSDKYFRGYEKGKQLAAKLAPAGSAATYRIGGHVPAEIYRCEVEFKADGATIPWDAIGARDRFFAGAYPFCETVLPGIRPCAVRRRAKITEQPELSSALAHIQRQFGSTLYTALAAYEGDIGAVWQRICGTGHSPRLLKAGALLASRE